MIQRINEIRTRLAEFKPLNLEIIDESEKHAGHAGARDGGGHYVVHIVSDSFSGKSKIERHRMIYCAIGELMKREIHALTIQALAPNEL